MSSKKPAVGMMIAYFPSGATQPFAGTIAQVLTDGKINIGYFDGSGAAQSRQSVAFVDEATGGDYCVMADDGDTTAATKKHEQAARKAGVGQPAKEHKDDPKAQAAAEAAQAAGDFSSATLDPSNKQAPGTGGPFDPANTSAAHMTQHQRMEGQSIGQPTTGGMTPKLTPANMGDLSERDREAAEAIMDAKTPEEKATAANASTGAATPGSAEMIQQAEKDRAKRSTPEAAAKVAKDAVAMQEAARKAAPPPAPDMTEEQLRVERAKQRHEEALRLSAEKTIGRGRSAEADEDAEDDAADEEEEIEDEATAERQSRKAPKTAAAKKVAPRR